MATFVARDFEILGNRYPMEKWFYRGSWHGIPDRLIIPLLVRRTDFNVSWFGYHQAHWAVRYSRRIGRKSIVILGGFDVCEEEDPSLPARLEEVRYILGNADRILAVSKRVRQKALAINPNARVDVVYHGFDASVYRPSGQKKRIATTVGYVNREYLHRKGLEAFVRSAALVPDCRFLVVGKWLDDAIDYLRSIATDNVEFLGRVPMEDLVRVLQESAVYVQVSAHEGFGCSLAEAMLCECVPVVTDLGAIPEVVGDVGHIVPYDDPESTASAIREALTSGEGAGARARDRIARLFSLESRKNALLAAVEETIRT